MQTQISRHQPNILTTATLFVLAVLKRCLLYKALKMQFYSHLLLKETNPRLASQKCIYFPPTLLKNLRNSNISEADTTTPNNILADDRLHIVTECFSYTEGQLTDGSAAAQLTLFAHVSTNCSTLLNTVVSFSAFWLQNRT